MSKVAAEVNAPSGPIVVFKNDNYASEHKVETSIWSEERAQNTLNLRIEENDGYKKTFDPFPTYRGHKQTNNKQHTELRPV